MKIHKILLFLCTILFLLELGTCVEKECPNLNERYSCGNEEANCERRCENYLEPCVNTSKRCHMKCYCKTGYIRNSLNECVLPEACNSVNSNSFQFIQRYTKHS